MAQCFVSTYRNHYRWNDPEVTPSCKPHDDCLSVIPPEDIWITNEACDDKTDSTMWEERLRRTYLKRMLSTYQVSYCRDMIGSLLRETTPSCTENQLLTNAKNLYRPDTRPKIAPPLLNTRRAFGYIRPTLNYTPLTTYQEAMGQTAFMILNGEYKRNKIAETKSEKIERIEDIIIEKEKEESESKVKKRCECCCFRK